MTDSRGSDPSRASSVFLFCTVCKTSSGLIHPSVQLILSGIFRPGVRRLECEASSEVNARCCTVTHALNLHGDSIATLQHLNVQSAGRENSFTSRVCVLHTDRLRGRKISEGLVCTLEEYVIPRAWMYQQSCLSLVVTICTACLNI